MVSMYTKSQMKAATIAGFHEQAQYEVDKEFSDP